MELWTVEVSNRTGDEANLAFGALPVVPDVTEAARLLLDEVVFSQDQHLDLFGAGTHVSVCELL
jgi:hypothetical protein